LLALFLLTFADVAIQRPGNASVLAANERLVAQLGLTDL